METENIGTCGLDGEVIGRGLGEEPGSVVERIGLVNWVCD